MKENDTDYIEKLLDNSMVKLENTFLWARQEKLNLISKVILLDTSIMAFSATILGFSKLPFQNSSLLKASWTALIFDVVIGILLYDEILERHKEVAHQEYFVHYNKKLLKSYEKGEGLFQGSLDQQKIIENLEKRQSNLESLEKGERFRQFKRELVGFFSLFVVGIIFLLVSVCQFT